MSVLKNNLESVLIKLRTGVCCSYLIFDLISLKEEIEDDNIEVLDMIDNRINEYF